jgi:hypothetical protein
VTAVDFFTQLYAGQTGFIELRPVKEEVMKYRRFVEVQNGVFDYREIHQYVTIMNNLKHAAYFGVALRTSAARSMKKAGGSLDQCQVLSALFVDADYKHRGEEITRRRLRETQVPPSMIVATGGGLHAYWLHRPAYQLGLNKERVAAAERLRELAQSLRDVVDVSVSEPARILRIPGSYNFKEEYGDPRLVVLERVPPQLETTFDDDLIADEVSHHE